jgi:SNF2 family DNA or RNA helicase
LFVVALIKELHRKGHRTLIFSQSKVMLDILGAELQQMKLRFLRIDGSLSAAQREVTPSATDPSPLENMILLG